MPEKRTLIVMRLANMFRVHPKQTQGVCARCNEAVGIYPSGQAAIRRFGPENVEIVCEICHPPGAFSVLAPGAEREPFESQPKSEESGDGS